MTSVSQQSSIPNKASNSSSASQSTPSYASTAKKAVSSPPVATGSSTPSPAVAVGGSAPVQQHGKSSSISPVNGRTSIPPAVPAVSAPAVAHSSSAFNSGATDHSRKSSVTISATGPSGYVANGGPVGGSKGGIQFGSITDSPAASHSTPQIAQSTSAPIPIPSNPRVTSPAQSPSPIPQQIHSGGRPPSGLTGSNNGVTFGSLPGDGDRHMRQASGTHASAASGSTQATVQLRRESQSNNQSDMSNQSSNRGGFGGGRGRGNFNPQYQQQQMGYPPSNAPYNRNQGQGRGAMAPPFQGQGRPMGNFPNSPHQAARSPALTPSMPGTPNMNQAMPMQNPQQHYNAYGGYPQMPTQQVHPSFNSHPSHEPFNYNGRGARGKSKKNEKFAKRQRQNSRELFCHPIASQMPERRFSSDCESFGYQELRNFQPPLERSGPGHFMHIQQTNGPPPEAPMASRHASDEQSSSSLPPFPPSLFLDLQFETKLIDLSPASGNFDQFLTRKPQYPYPAQYDPRSMQQMQGGYMYPQMGYMSGAPPQSPQPGFQHPQNAYIPGQYAPQPMSRNSSQMSDQRPASSMGQPQTPSMTPTLAQPQTLQAKANTTQNTSYPRPARKSAAIVIKRPDGGALDLQSFKAPASPAPSTRARTPPVIASTPTPPPQSATPQHTRTDSVPAKSSDQIKAEIAEKVRKAAESDKAESERLAAENKAKAEEAAKLAEEKRQEEEKAKAEAEAKAAEEAKAKEEAEAKAAAEKAKKDEEDELERQIAEMEAAEVEREKKEAEALAKRAAAKAAEAKANEAKHKAEAEENDRRLKEQEREMERLEDENEKKRAEAEAKLNGDKVDIKTQIKNSLKGENKDDAPATPSTLASKLSNLTLGTGSGTSAPASDDSMGPPPPKAAPTKKVPAALNLAPLNTKPVEPPQPSAALQSLKSARFLSAINPALYPTNISSPNPALNSAVAAKGKSFKYDKEFLLQFQKVFVEKPSMEFESQIKALIGDGDGGSARSASARGGGGMGPRSSSTRGNAPGAFAMGQFGAGVGGKTLPPGTTSAERFAMSSGSASRPAINAMSSFSRPGGAFPSGIGMTRTPSSSNMGYNMPNSPRQSNRSQRGGSKRDSHQGGNGKSEAQAAKTMPLTAGMDLRPIQVSAGGWKPRSIGAPSATGAAGPTPGAAGGTGHMEPDMVQRKVKAALNKMTPEKFDKIADQILAIAAQSKDEADGRTLRQVIQLTFEKATDEAHWASMYAKFCKRMLETMSPDIKDESILDKNGNIVSGGNLFRKYLLNRCQEEFERGWKLDLPDKPEGERGDEKSAEAAMLSDEYYIAAAAKRRGLGLVQFIGELYKLSMLTERIMHECVRKLVDYTGIPDDAEIESLTKLLKTIGSNLDSTEKGKPMMNVYFTRIQAMIDTPDLPSRLRFMLMDVVDLRKKRWASKENNKGPKTLDEVRVEAEAAAAQKAAENARGPRGGGGGGRMQMGRGDSRNFQNQYGNQPPVDYQKNTVGMDDLRRLTNKGGANRHISQNMSFGPTAMFSSRSNSGRKMGPGGSLSRAGEDSGASSRTGTPPQQKEKESATSANAFSLLAQLGSGETENPASPPSSSVSPALSKATPATAEKSSGKKDNEP
ncbi:putative eukaryotic translation initiation factor 4 gamma [Amylocarpus encephaloides]|uniref:Eukaryotic translation initiation factor 4 gamma n=1 Tax=Amylocarpus encephaloides TaxID=45428 RepID=A0A9P7YK62_9HELO|nr:putative eukaryotic translation initiation factor 4 gamma [Amylocarpus encephaloides]